MNGDIQTNGPVDLTSEVMTPGHRHLLQLLSHRTATEPDRIYGSIPIDPDNLSKGFKDITYSDFSNAIDHCIHWLKDVLPPAPQSHETFAYIGPKDIRYPILACASAKLDRKILFPSSSVTPAGQEDLIKKTECRTYLYDGAHKSTVEEVVHGFQEWDIKIVEVSGLDVFLREEKAEPWDWEKSWDEAKDLPWFIGHTSGTTGLPKPITWTHGMMACFEVANLMPEIVGKETILDHLKGRRWYSPMPLLHLVGMFVALSLPLNGDAIVVYGPPGDLTTEMVCESLKYGKCQATLTPPLFLDDLISDPKGFEILRQLDYIYFVGAPLSPATAKEIVPHTPIFPCYGTTESGICWVEHTGDNDWEYFTFRASNGIEFEQVDGDIHEMLIVKRPELQRWQLVFDVYPELDIFRTGDLWVESKNRPGAWKVIGRSDDMICLSHSYKMNAAEMEMELNQCSGVSGVVIGGNQRDAPFVIVEWENDEEDDNGKLEKIWPAIEKVNERCSEIVRIRRDKVLFTTPEKRLKRNVKGGPARNKNVELFEEEIEQLYK